MTSQSVSAHAKLNLNLFVGPPRPPKGYHPIRSWFVAVDLHDTVRIDRLGAGEATRVEIGWAANAPRPTPIDWPVEKDLAARAHALLERSVGRALPVRLRVEKRIPVGGGLGGGSSDAAATLMGVNRLFGLGLGRDRLAELSAALGSDVAFFIDEQTPPRPAVVGGFGEQIERVGVVEGEVVLIFPSFGCPTAAVYEAFDREAGQSGSDPAWVDAQVREALSSGCVPAERLFNDLTRGAMASAPELSRLLPSLDAAARRLIGRDGRAGPARVHLTGSGSTMFCVAPRGVSAVEVAQGLRGAAPGCVLVTARLV